MRMLYINANPSTKTRATALGCGWMSTVPPEFTSVATSPCVIISGAGQTVVISDNPPTTTQAVNDAAQPIITAEALLDSRVETERTNAASITTKLSAAISANNNFLALSSPTNAQVVAYLRVVARELNGLSRLASSRLDIDDS